MLFVNAFVVGLGITFGVEIALGFTIAFSEALKKGGKNERH